MIPLNPPLYSPLNSPPNPLHHESHHRPLVALIGLWTCFAAPTATGQYTGAPAPVRTTVAEPDVTAPRTLAQLVHVAEAALDREDPLAALAGFVAVRAVAPEDAAGLLGMARTYLFLGRPGIATAYVEAVRRLEPDREDAIALHVRILIRAAKFDQALRVSTRALRVIRQPSVELHAAHASVLFRVQRTVDAAGVYQRVLAIDPLHAEAHLRLGSGLLPPCRVKFVAEINLGIRAQRRGELDVARLLFVAALASDPGHPIAHRLLGETLYQQRHARSMAHLSPLYRELASALPVPSVDGLALEKFFPSYEGLSEPRRAVAARALNLFGSLLPKLVAMRGRHDILREDERTTDAFVRANLRGKRTFDGRVWDDVRGIGGLRAATGIEALDEAARFEFDTLSHELAHQAHLYAFRPVHRARLRSLYRDAKVHGHCLDFYAASNEAEYFGQGVEAFVSLAKRPGGEKTHCHTRFELFRVDPALYRFIASRVEFDPLRSPEGRARLLPLAAAVALRCGRPADAVAAAEMMDDGAAKDRLLTKSRRALRLSQTW